jgi:hypothetical protein
VNTGLIFENMSRYKDRYAATLLRIFERLQPWERADQVSRHAVPRSALARYSDA